MMENGDTNAKHIEWCKSRINTLNTQANKAPTFNEGIKTRCKATSLWKKVNADKLNSVMGSSGAGDCIPTTDASDALPIQDFSEKPVLIGGDAIALYPSLDMVGTVEMIAEVIVKSKVVFKNIDLNRLLVYLTLVLGEDTLKDYGLGPLIPKRSKWVESKAKSLSCKINKELNNWIVNTENISWEEERMLVALAMKCAMLALMNSTCYSFGGQIFKQMWGAGIGLRASACMAKLVMGIIDKKWAGIQLSWDVKIYLYFRYIDDLRIYMHPISKGWTWD